MNEMGWMVHGTELCRERVRRFNAQAEVDANPLRLLRRLKWELEWREYVLKMVNAGRVRELSPVGRVWWEYMRNKARLEIAWNDNEISETVFRVRSGHLRRRRDERLASMNKERAA